jgi:hypothetical protein
MPTTIKLNGKVLLFALSNVNVALAQQEGNPHDRE